jgi:NADPH-dependent glutamate synthase beta chain and related oxidoreductases
LEEFGVALDARGNVATNADYMSSVPGLFAAGDMRRGQSLVVWAISEGRKAAVGVDRYLKETARNEVIPATLPASNRFRARVSQSA